MGSHRTDAPGPSGCLGAPDVFFRVHADPLRCRLGRDTDIGGNIMTGLTDFITRRRELGLITEKIRQYLIRQ